MNHESKVYEKISFPPLTDEQKKELEFLKNMSDSEIDFSDIPETDLSEAVPYYQTKTEVKHA